MARVGEVLRRGAEESLAPPDASAQLVRLGDRDIHPRFLGEGDDRLDAIERCPEVAIGEVRAPDAEQEAGDGPRRRSRDERVQRPFVQVTRRLGLAAQLRETPPGRGAPRDRASWGRRRTSGARRGRATIRGRATRRGVARRMGGERGAYPIGGEACATRENSCVDIAPVRWDAMPRVSARHMGSRGLPSSPPLVVASLGRPPAPLLPRRACGRASPTPLHMRS
jgi:hypothetical protein